MGLTGHHQGRYKSSWAHGVAPPYPVSEAFHAVEENRNSKQAACQPIADLLSDLVRDCHGRASTTARAVWEFWDGVVGETVAGNAQPAAFKERLLIVHVSSSAWLQELHFQKTDLIQRLNRAAGATVVEEIRFKLGTLPTK
jgi:predicted nucleic acid-binding Zn ribbon protein